jgi:hypothetical protein
MKKVKPRRGDVFEIETPDGKFGYGLVVEGGGCPYIAILDEVYVQRPPIEELAGKEVVLAGWTMDSWFYHGRWTVIGATDPAQFNVPFPNYVVGIEGELHVTDYKGTILGKIRTAEVGVLDNQSIRVPVGFQNAFLAMHGYQDWNENFEKLTVVYLRERMMRA